MSLSGGKMLVQTDNGIKVSYDGDHRAEVTVPSTYKLVKLIGLSRLA